jgi:hypothetical protein
LLRIFKWGGPRSKTGMPDLPEFAARGVKF